MPGKSGKHAKGKVQVTFWLDQEDAQALKRIARKFGTYRASLLAEMASGIVADETTGESSEAQEANPSLPQTSEPPA